MGEEGEPIQSTVNASGSEDEVNLNIRCSNSAKFSVRASLKLSVADFKNVVAQNCDVPAEQQRLIYKGRILKDDQSLDSYGKFMLCWVLCVLRCQFWFFHFPVRAIE